MITHRSTSRSRIAARFAPAAAAALAAWIAPPACPASPASPAPPAKATQSTFDQVPEELKGVDVVEHLDSRLPLDLTFTDERGETVRLGDYFKSGRPVILTLNYYECAMLCNLSLNGMIKSLKELDWSAGEQFDIVSISFNPKEPWQLARAKREAYLISYDRKGAEAGWHFHVGEQANIEKLTQAVGFNYRLQPDGEYAHAAVTIMCTPDGRVSRYLYGIQPPARDFRLALTEAGDGKVGSAFDRFILWCHRYDPHSNSYVKSAMRIMQLGGVVTVLVMGVGLSILWRIDFLKGRQQRTLAAEAAGQAIGLRGGLQT